MKVQSSYFLSVSVSKLLSTLGNCSPTENSAREHSESHAFIKNCLECGQLEVGTSESESLVNINNELKLKGNEKNVSSLAIPKDNFDATCSKTKKDIADYVDVKLNNHEKIEARDLL
ncbi:hypothetical protein HELRODRAFT_173903 [Helobdella robusta]|uniref:Uncharacterized protein n=1 Tax=Helobdella robusta TaxID=6412 RepID=T1F7C5_HELRO|nr:hypothetical protein HELRODRAFT_173903 [Helobdella robusta]ESO03037.1 hypothetical protein HELRODRAFT_173903 [Helobdella robusta]